MDWGSPVFVLAIIALSYSCWLVNNWIRAKNGYALENEWGGTTEKSNTVEAQQLRAENRELLKKLDTMQDRMIVLEKIVTDRGYSLSEEIEALRDKRGDETGSVMSLDFSNKETA
ncbi:hypothetical protein P7228_01870 [Altererythrobacter arenosus]|uniref:Uncharacterized protein n=1 Tax=Altererythrobacter arenosus TaxID=3032592 RepID=A0ABY8FX68_9SPHN|nr:hypothetical protein [Altererythrobacter sp. CAU 1644]WFL77841.1 hypothetical protein P7228_01870 [Altererythrobacter sp. CAU 1644]